MRSLAAWLKIYFFFIDKGFFREDEDPFKDHNIENSDDPFLEKASEAFFPQVEIVETSTARRITVRAPTRLKGPMSPSSVRQYQTFFLSYWPLKISPLK